MSVRTGTDVNEAELKHAFEHFLVQYGRSQASVRPLARPSAAAALRIVHGQASGAAASACHIATTASDECA
jgi:hypothetical protein